MAEGCEAFEDVLQGGLPIAVEREQQGVAPRPDAAAFRKRPYCLSSSLVGLAPSDPR